MWYAVKSEDQKAALGTPERGGTREINVLGKVGIEVVH